MFLLPRSRLACRAVIYFLLTSFTVLSSVSAQAIPSEQLQGLAWRLIGPFRGGRVTAVAGISGDTKTYYLGTPGGGVWKTTDACSTWFPIFDAAHVASVGDLVVAPSNPSIIYVATGEQTDGNGVWKSVDAGATWTNIGLGDSHIIPSILVDPHDANLVYVAAAGGFTPSEARGIFKSTDGGKTWRKVFYKDDHTSATELVFVPGDSRTILAVLRPMPSGLREKAPEDTMILKSSDAGETWSPVEGKGLPSERRGRIGLAVAPGLAGKRIFALLLQGLFRSNDAGANWEQITADPRILGSEYFGKVYSDTKDPDVVYIMQTSTYRSSDGGRTFVAWKGTPSGEDDHVLWIAPEDSKRILMGTDQGAVITFDGGKIWNSWFNQPTGQFYRVSTDLSFPYRLYASQQDSGSVAVSSRSDFGLITYRDWFSSGAFESSFIAPDPLNSDFVYSIGWYGNVIRMDRTTGQIATLFMSPPNYRTAWETPLVFSPHDPHTLYFGSQFLLKTTDGGQTWKEISPDLTSKPGEKTEAAKSPAAGHVPTREDFESAGIFGEEEDSGAQATTRTFIQSIAPSPLDVNLIWVGTSSGQIQITRDAATWNDVTPPGLPERATVNSIEPSAHDPKTAFAAIFVRRDTRPYFFRTRDGGKTWEKIITGLRDVGIARVVREDPARKGLLFAGTENGVYISYDSGDHWQEFQLNLPTSSVRDLTIHGDDLVAATFGRGLWILDDISPLRQLAPGSANQSAQFFAPQTAIRAHWDNHPDTPLQPGMPTAQNPPDGAILYYFLDSPPKGEMSLDIFSDQGARIRHFSTVTKVESLPPANVPEFWFFPPERLLAVKGLNRFVWDLQYPHPTALPYGFFGEHLKYTEYTLPDHAVPGETPRFQPPGPVVPPGVYELVLTVDGKAYRQKLRVAPDPRVHISKADYDAQFDLSRKICDLMESSAGSYETVAQLQKQLDERSKSLAGDPPKEVSGALADVAKQLKDLEAGTATSPGFGILNRDLGRYLEMVQAGDIAPTDSARQAYARSCDAYKKDVVALGKLTTESVPAVNKLLAPRNIAPLTLSAPASVVAPCAP